MGGDGVLRQCWERVELLEQDGEVMYQVIEGQSQHETAPEPEPEPGTEHMGAGGQH